MKIAMLAPPWIKVPPAGYGGIEWVVHYLTESLVERGHEVTLFASGDSATSAELDAVFFEEMPDRIGHSLYEVQHVSACMRRAGEFDLIHDHSGFAAVAFAPYIDTPLVHTLHGPFTPDTSRFYQSLRDAAHYVAISEYQRGCCPELNYAGTVYNPIDVSTWPFVESSAKGDYLLAFGRFSPDKGFHTAIEVAREAGERLIMAGAVQNVNRDYFETVINPLVDGDRIQYVGEVSLSAKWKLFAEARAFLFPIQWPEPFGLVMIEAMATGTPVIAFPEGSVPEVVADGVTGFVVPDSAGMVEAISRVGEIDAQACRDYVIDKFSVSRATSGYEEVYSRVLAGGARG
ncbi:MAG: glycosyltransferase family 4 protein [Gaiellales bacterium]|nr:MAG: glycosyltransferase family 4 protein [Gaiellales bacterium]